MNRVGNKFTFGNYISMYMSMNEQTQQRIADALHRDQGYVSRKLRDCSFAPEEWRVISEVTGCEDILVYGLGKQIKPLVAVS